MKNIFLILFFSLSELCSAQINFVQNGDFFEFLACPNQAGQFNLVKNWFSINCTPEYFHSCSNSTVNVPNTLLGFQYGKNKNSYAGITLFFSQENSYREYIQIKLNQPLEKNLTYCVIFYVNLADLSSVAIDKIGAHFSYDSLNPFVFNGLIELQPQVSNSYGLIIKDTVSWTQISGKFIAQGNEQFMSIGNFFSDENTIYEIIDTSIINTKFAYYFIDDVSVYECDEETTNDIALPNAFTPNGDGVNDVFRVQGQNIKTLNGKILNRWGQELYNWTDVSSGWDGMYKEQEAAEGTYFYVVSVEFEDGVIKSFTGSVLLTR